MPAEVDERFHGEFVDVLARVVKAVNLVLGLLEHEVGLLHELLDVKRLTYLLLLGQVVEGAEELLAARGQLCITLRI